MEASADLKSYFQAAGIYILLPSDSRYASTCSTYYQLVDVKHPLAVVRPQNPQDVAAIVRYATHHGHDVIVRSGGGDLFGRSQVENALLIDMRSLCHIEVDTDLCIARIGGGCSVGQIAACLTFLDLVTPCPAVPAIGYAGWAMLGGYGPLAQHYGLGVDQIMSGRVVTGKGDFVDANDEMLKGIRGGGGNLGIVTELTIRLYPLQKIFGGSIVYDATDMEPSFTNYASAYDALLKEGLPQELHVQPIVFNSAEGQRTFAVKFTWTSPDLTMGTKYLNKVSALGKETERTVRPMAFREWVDETSKLTPWGVHGPCESVTLRAVTPQIAKVIARHLAAMPSDPGTYFTWHELRGDTATHRERDCVFGAPRQPHYVLQISGAVVDRVNLADSQAWARDFRAELLGCDEVLDFEYVALADPAHASVERMYGANLAELRRLKRKYDPRGVFDLAVPRLGERGGG